MKPFQVMSTAIALVDEVNLGGLIAYVETFTDEEKEKVVSFANSNFSRCYPSDPKAVVARDAFKGEVKFDKAKGLPPLRDDLRDFEKAAGLSVDVVVRFKAHDNLALGRYLHGIGEWQINGIHGTYHSDHIEEWWLMPAVGTGTAPEIKKEGE